MKIKMLKINTISLKLLKIINILYVACCQRQFSSGSIRHQINDKNIAILFNQSVEMLSEGFRCYFGGLWINDVFIHTFLIPEYWHRSTNHNKAHNRIPRLYNLFCFNEISNITKIINATCIESCPASLNASSRYQCDLEVSSLNISFLNPDKALNDGAKPSNINFLVYQVFVHLNIPEVVLITSNHSYLAIIFTLRLRLHFQEINSPLARGSQVIPIGKVMALC